MIQNQARVLVLIFSTLTFGLYSPTAFSECYNYDELGRLISVIYDDANTAKRTYNLDEHGNRTTVVDATWGGGTCLPPTGIASTGDSEPAGGGGQPPPPGDTTPPVVMFTPSALTVASGATGTSNVSATDNVGVTSVSSASCTNGGSFAGVTFTAPVTATAVESVCTVSATDAAGNVGMGTLTVNVFPVPPLPPSCLNDPDPSGIISCE